MKYRHLALLGLCLLYCSPSAFAVEANYMDSVVLLAEHGIIKGYEDGSLRPDAPVTRAEFATMLYRASGEPELAYIASYPDMLPDDWFQPAISYATDQGVIRGYEDGMLHPHRPVSFAEALTMLARSSGTTLSGASWKDAALAYGDTLQNAPNLEADDLLTRGETAATLLASGPLFSEEFSLDLPSTSTLYKEPYFQTLSREDQDQVLITTLLAQGTVSIVSADSDLSIDIYLRNSGVVDASVTHGTGFFLTPRLIVTNGHVVRGGEDHFEVFGYEGKSLPVSKVLFDPVFDIALIELQSSAKASPVRLLFEEHTPYIGQTVYSMGNSLGRYPYSVSEGIVSGLGRKVTAYGEDTSVELFDLIQTDANVSLGNSGGPLFDAKGIVLGMTTAFDQEGENIGFAIPTPMIRSSWETYTKFGRLTKPYLGIRYTMIDPEYMEEHSLDVARGAHITSFSAEHPAVIPGSPAEKAGLQAGDVITYVGDYKVGVDGPLLGLLSYYRADDTVKLGVLRDGRNLTLYVSPQQK